jgi:hypothetical protein
MIYFFIMVNDSDTDRILAEAAERIRREAYAAGWRDAMAAVSRAATDLAPPDSLPDSTSSGTGDLSPSGNSAAATGGVTMGSTPWYVLQAVRRKPGMTGLEVVNVVQEGGHRVSQANIRTSLVRLGRKKLIVSRHRKWFPA